MDPLYQSFIAAVESDSLVQAADKLHITQPTLSRQIQQVEERMGYPLFDRVGKRLVLNQAGDLAYQVAKRCVALEDRLREELQSLADPEVGTIHIGAGLTPSIHLLPPLVAAYRRDHPSVLFDIRSGSSRDVLAWLKHRDIDLAVVTTLSPSATEVSSFPVVDDPLLLVAAANQSVASRLSFADLSHMPMVVLREGSGLRDLVVRLAAQHGVSLTIAAETDSLESISRLVEHGVGVSIVPASSVREDIAQGRILRVEMDIPLPSRTIQVVVPNDRALSAASMQFIRQLSAR